MRKDGPSLRSNTDPDPELVPKGIQVLGEVKAVLSALAFQVGRQDPVARNEERLQVFVVALALYGEL